LRHHTGLRDLDSRNPPPPSRHLQRPK
jgi:hypothetical protein